MRLPRLALGVLALATASACSSSSTNSSGSGGTGGSATGGSAGSATGGESSGGTGGSATGGTSGSATGGTSGSATGGSAGSATGGSAGSATGGAAGSPTDAGSDAGTVVVGNAHSVYCGPAAPTCSVNSEGRCCFTPGDAGTPYVCQNSAASCDEQKIQCDSSNDCGTGQVCCFKKNFVTPGSATCVLAADCHPSNLDGGTLGFSATQLCDPTKTSPTECVYPSGSSCKPSTNGSLPPVYFTCQP